MPFLPTTRRRFIRLAAATGVAALAIDSTLIEPNRPRIVRREIALRRWPARLDGFTIAVLSDFHYDPYFSVHPLHSAIGMVNGLHAELIVLTGDFVSVPVAGGDAAAAASAAEPCARLLRQMQAPHGLWAVMGNHDCATDPDRVTSALRAEGIQVLSNQSVPVERDGGRFWLGGVDDVLSGGADLGATLHHVPADEATVLLAHEPDYAELCLALSGGSSDLRALSRRSGAAAFRWPCFPAGYGQEVRLGSIQGRWSHALHQPRPGHSRNSRALELPS